jgi:hypothetical protein
VIKIFEEEEGEEEPIEGMPGRFTKRRIIALVLLVCAIAIGLSVYFFWGRIVSRENELAEEETVWTISPVLTQESKVFQGRSGMKSSTNRTVTLPRHLKEVTFTLYPGPDDSGTLFGKYGGPGDDLFLMIITSPDGKVFFENNTGIVSKTITFEEKPIEKNISKTELFKNAGPEANISIERKLVAVANELFPQDEWKVEIGVKSHICDYKDMGNSWRLEVEYTYWKPSW